MDRDRREPRRPVPPERTPLRAPRRRPSAFAQRERTGPERWATRRFRAALLGGLAGLVGLLGLAWLRTRGLWESSAPREVQPTAQERRVDDLLAQQREMRESRAARREERERERAQRPDEPVVVPRVSIGRPVGDDERDLYRDPAARFLEDVARTGLERAVTAWDLDAGAIGLAALDRATASGWKLVRVDVGEPSRHDDGAVRVAAQVRYRSEDDERAGAEVVIELRSTGGEPRITAASATWHE